MYIANRKGQDILDIFLNKPTTEHEQADIERQTGFSRTTIIKWLKYLLKEEFITSRTIGRSNLLRLNNEKTIVRLIKSLFIVSQLSNIWIKDTEIYLFGSCAWGDYTDNSDIDLLILGKVKRSEIVNLMENRGKQIKRNIHFQIFTHQEWSMMRKKDQAFYKRVEKDKIRLE